MTVINPKSISGITSITMPSGADNVLTIHTTDGTERFRIDSSGNVKVGSAATISPDGDLFVTGVCTATTLSGAASGLTGALPAISAANLTNVPAANVTGTLPAISGANLTNLAAANLTGTIADGRFPATLPAASAANLTSIPAANVTGTLPALTAANLTNIPAANIVGVATAGFGNASGAYTQGITEADQWRLAVALTTNDSTVIYNLERNDNYFAKIGTGVATNAGNWTFPVTGIWLITFNWDGYTSTQTRYVGGYIDLSSDSGSSFGTLVETYNSTSSDTNAYATGSMSAIVDITNTSTQRVRFRVSAESNFVFNGSTNINRTYFTFLRLGDT